MIGNPIETFVAGCRLLVGGVFDRHPDLRVLLVHGGGALPYQLGRLQHAYEVREETNSVAERPPLDVSREPSLRHGRLRAGARCDYLIDLVGPERVVFGTDLPFDMGDDAAIRQLRDGPHSEVADRVLGENALELFGIGQSTGSPAASVR